MSEVLEIGKQTLLLLGLFYFAWKDYKTKMVAIRPLLGFAVLGVGACLLQGTFSVEVMLGNLAVGGVCFFLSVLTKESIGFGDALLFLATGMYLGGLKNLVLFCGSVFLIGGFSVICLLIKKINRNDRIPMIPFVFVTAVLLLLEESFAEVIR